MADLAFIGRPGSQWPMLATNDQHATLLYIYFLPNLPTNIVLFLHILVGGLADVVELDEGRLQSGRVLLRPLLQGIPQVPPYHQEKISMALKFTSGSNQRRL
jgi:hypothetical protein